MKRFSVSLDKTLLDKFDTYVFNKKYNNRSEALRDLIRGAFVQKEWHSDASVMGVITLVYDHHQSPVQEKMTTIQHDYYHQIISTTHVHIDHHNCMEVIIAKGKAVEVQELADRLIALKGIKNGNLAMSSTGKELG